MMQLVKPGARLARAPSPGVFVLSLDWPSPDRWIPRQASDLAHTLSTAAAQGGARAVILTGPEIFGSPPPDGPPAGGEDLDEILALISTSPLPVVAAIPGDARGAGLELAIACAARLATPSAQLSLPAVAAGGLPRLETLRRLPDLVGLEAAVAMAALAQPLGGAEARSRGLLDGLDDGDLMAAAARLAGALDPRPAGRGGETDPVEGQAQFFLMRRRLRDQAPGQAAPLGVVRAMEAAAQLRPRAAGAEVARIAGDLACDPQGLALRHAAQASAGLARRGVVEADLARLAQRLWWPMAREAIHLLDEGASPTQVDRAFVAYGFSSGPFETADARGFAAIFSTGDGQMASGDDWLVYSPTLDLMADSGRLGGAAPGWLQPPAPNRSRFEPAVDRLIQSSAISQRLRRAPLGDDQVMARCLNAAVNAAFAALEARPDLTPEDLDALWLSRLGFPRWKGGPVYQARLRGLEAVAAELAAAAARRNTAGTPCPRLLAAGDPGGRRQSLAAGERG